MKENLLQFIWKLKLFSTKNLQAVTGESVKIISAGIENLNSGPDFLNAKILIANQLWFGNVEIHVKSSDWYVHNHENNSNYSSIILHVVWEHDVEVFRSTNSTITTLALKEHVSNHLIESYTKLFQQHKKWINCENLLQFNNSFSMLHWYERLYFERLEQKTRLIHTTLTQTNFDWEATLFILLAKGFGLKLNGEAFYNFATSLDFSVVRKVSSNLFQLEALFFGQAGLLSENFETRYFNDLKKEYNYLKTKFKLTEISSNQMQFFRLRPNNFPTIRLSQLAMLYFKNRNLFSICTALNSLEAYYKLFSTATSSFWETHYTFSKESKPIVKKLSKSFINLLLINTIIPLNFYYLKYNGKTDFTKLFLLLEEIKPEQNTTIIQFKSLKFSALNAFETQALLQLKTEYCDAKKCLNCEIGKNLLAN